MAEAQTDINRVKGAFNPRGLRTRRAAGMSRVWTLEVKMSVLFGIRFRLLPRIDEARDMRVFSEQYQTENAK